MNGWEKPKFFYWHKDINNTGYYDKDEMDFHLNWKNKEREQLRQEYLKLRDERDSLLAKIKELEKREG